MNAQKPGGQPGHAHRHSSGSDRTIVPDNVPVELIQRLTEAAMRREGRQLPSGEIRFLCPVHDDHNPDADWNPVEAVWFCHVCQIGAGAFDLAKRLGIDQPDREREPIPFASRPQRRLADRQQVKPSRTMGLGSPTSVYPYYGPDGTFRYEVLRYEPKTFRQRRPDGNGGTVWNLDGVERVPYRLPVLIASEPEALIWIVEGEKCADRLASMDQIATTVAGGWSGEKTCLSVPFAGHHVAIIPDNDQQGETGAIRTYNVVGPVAASVQIVRLPGVEPKGDVSDWLDAGHSVDDLKDLLEDPQSHTR